MCSCHHHYLSLCELVITVVLLTPAEATTRCTNDSRFWKLNICHIHLKRTFLGIARHVDSISATSLVDLIMFTFTAISNYLSLLLEQWYELWFIKIPFLEICWAACLKLKIAIHVHKYALFSEKNVPIIKDNFNGIWKKELTQRLNFEIEKKLFRHIFYKLLRVLLSERV